MATAIKKKPTAKVTGLGAPTSDAGSHNMHGKWGVPASAKKDSNNARLQGFDVRWTPTLVDLKTGKTRKLDFTKRYANASLTQASLRLSDFNGWKAQDGKTYALTSLYPRSGTWAIKSIALQVRAYNSKGVGPWVAATRNFLTPVAPQVSAASQDKDTGSVSVTVTPSEDYAYRPRYDTYHTRSIYDSRTGETITYTGSTTTSSEFTLSYDVADRMQLTYDQYVRLTFEARCRALSGDSATVKRTLYVSWPNKPTLAGVDVPSDPSGKVTVRLNLNATTEHPTTGVQLEKLVGVSYATADEIPGNADWSECGAVDNGGCTALSATVAEVNPSVGTRTWVRVKVWNQAKEIFYRYSDPIQLEELYRETNASAGGATIISALPGTDGTSADLLIGWATDEADGTEVSWSTDEDAWRSTREPSKFDVEWDDGQQTIGSTTWAHTATLHIAQLTSGETYHVRTRRYIDTDAGRQYGSYWPTSGSVMVTPSTQATQITLTAPQVVPRGEGLTLTWAYDVDATQRAWQLVTGTVVLVNGETVTDPETQQSVTIQYPTIAAANRIVVAEGADALGSHTIAAERMNELAINGELAVAVLASTGGDWIESHAVVVAIADAPTLAVTASTLTAQPAQLALVCSSPDADVTVVVRAQGAQGDSPIGTVTQAANDTVWAAVISPEWSPVYDDEPEPSIVGYSAAVTLDAGLDFWDGASYTTTATATDRTTGLTSDVASEMFAVDWSRKAPEPLATVTPYDTTDADSDIRTCGCSIQLATPESGISTDLCDVYRLTHDGVYPVAIGVATNQLVNDTTAPYGDGAELAYRVALRTADGAIEWDDFAYVLAGRDLRIDYGDSYVELPYSLAIDDGWTKDDDVRRKLDGSIDGYCGPGAERKADLSTQLIRVAGEQERRVRDLAKYAGVCLVRTPDGSCYPALVNVTTMAASCDSGAMSVSIEATEVDAQGSYLATVDVSNE